MSASGQDVDLAVFEFRPCNHNLKKSIYLSYYFSVLALHQTGILRFLVLPSKVATVLDTRRGWKTLFVETKADMMSCSHFPGCILQMKKCAQVCQDVRWAEPPEVNSCLHCPERSAKDVGAAFWYGIDLQCSKKGKKSWCVAQKHSGESLDRNTHTHTERNTQPGLIHE